MAFGFKLESRSLSSEWHVPGGAIFDTQSTSFLPENKFLESESPFT